jgi:hypothetical protein
MYHNKLNFPLSVVKLPKYNFFLNKWRKVLYWILITKKQAKKIRKRASEYIELLYTYTELHKTRMKVLHLEFTNPFCILNMCNSKHRFHGKDKSMQHFLFKLKVTELGDGWRRQTRLKWNDSGNFYFSKSSCDTSLPLGVVVNAETYLFLTMFVHTVLQIVNNF